MASQISPIGGEYKVRTITGDEFDVIYIRTSATVKDAFLASDACLKTQMMSGSLG